MSGVSTDAEVNDRQTLSSFIGKWSARWPEWRVAEVFVPVSEREPARAWFALRQELTDAAWAASDPRPGEAKLAWWAEELQGWSQGRRRHPLGIALQRQPAPWVLLATGLSALLASRERATDSEHAIATLEPFAEGVGGVAATLFAGDTQVPAASVIIGLLAEQLLLQGDGAVPLRTRAQVGDAIPEHASARAWACELLKRWPPAHGGAIPGRIHAGLLRERLRRFAAGRGSNEPLPPWLALWNAWGAARS